LLVRAAAFFQAALDAESEKPCFQLFGIAVRGEVLLPLLWARMVLCIF
jgi:hypothetical protein